MKTENDYLQEYFKMAKKECAAIEKDNDLLEVLKSTGNTTTATAAFGVINNIMARQAVKIDALEARIASLEDKLREGL